MKSHPRYNFILVPDSQPTGWPFENWICPTEMGLSATSFCFSTIDVWLDTHSKFSNRLINVKRYVFGFSDGIKPLAQIKVFDGVAYIAIEYLLLHKAFSASAFDVEDDVSEILDSAIAFRKLVSILNSDSDIYRCEVLLRAANAVLAFVICHELAHLNAGHFQLIRDHIRTRENVRAMEFSADRAALNQALVVLFDPLIRSNVRSSLLHDVGEAFGKSLTLILIARYQPNQIGATYPHTGERILILAGSCLDGCGGGSTGEMISAATHYAILSGLKRAIELIFRENDNGLTIPPELKSLVSLSPSSQRINCVGCSVWARQVYESARSKFDEVIKYHHIFLAYNLTPQGFNINDYRIVETYRRRQRHVCKLDHPFILSRGVIRLKIWLQILWRNFQRYYL